MKNTAGLVSTAFLVLASTLPVRAQGARVPDPHVDENPFGGETLKPMPAPGAAVEPVILASGRIGVRDVRTGEIGRPRSIRFEPAGALIREAGDGSEDPPAVVQNVKFRPMIAERENLDRWVLGEGISKEERTRHLKGLLLKRIERTARDMPLTDQQRSKLLLAGSGDIKRFFDRVEEMRTEFEAARKDQRAILQFVVRIDPLSVEFEQGPFEGDSFFAKTQWKIWGDNRPVPRPDVQ